MTRRWPALWSGWSWTRAVAYAAGQADGELVKTALRLRVGWLLRSLAVCVDVVAAGEAFAVTHGLLRPRILLSTGLVHCSDRAELTAVLEHQRHHLKWPARC